MPGPGSGPRSVKIGAMRLAEVFHGKKQKYKTTLEIERRAGFPLETGGLPLNYFSMATRWWSAWAPNYQSLVAQWSQLLRFNFTPSSLTQQMIDLYKLLMLGGTGGGAVPRGLFEPYSNSIELKQFRDSDNPETTCFMAMANMRSEVTAVNGMGMLGSIESMFTSMDGGYSIKIHRFPAYPVVEKLGLVVSHTEAAPEDEEDAVAIDTLTPCMPFWINMDFIVRGAEPLATLVHDDMVVDPPKECELPPYELERKFVVEEES